MLEWTSHERQMLLSPESRVRFEKARRDHAFFDDDLELRGALLDFIADFANWDNSTVHEFIETSRALTQAAHEALGGAHETRPLVVDPFAGGGSIPLEALRVGADTFASDLNPVAVILNKVVLEYIPKYGISLVEQMLKWGDWVRREVEKELSYFYPEGNDGATPIAYLWSRTIRCEGPGCGAEVPLIRSLWLAKKSIRPVALQLVPNHKALCVDYRIIIKQGESWVYQDDPNIKIDNPKFDGTIKRGSATCPFCGYTLPITRVRQQLKHRHGGADDARLLCVVTTRPDEQGRSYRLPDDNDFVGIQRAKNKLLQWKDENGEELSLIPNEPISLNEIRRISVPLYGMVNWGELFSIRQNLALATIARKVKTISEKAGGDPVAIAVQTLLSLALDRHADYNSSICRWVPAGEFIGNTFGRQAIPMIWDFCEVSPLSASTGGFYGACEWVVNVVKREANSNSVKGHVEIASAASHPLPSDSADAFISDPPYYDSVPYAYLSDFFYMRLKRSIGMIFPDLFSYYEVPKEDEIVVDRPHKLSSSNKSIEFYESELTKAFAEGRRVLRPEGVGTIVFASKTTASWEAILKAIVDAGWIITGSWPIDTEMEARIAAQGQARLASSVHLVCRPRENPDGSVQTDEIGDWREVLQELPHRIHKWMPRLANEGVVGADAIFACLGPALEIFSRYSHVEKTSGEVVTLREYLEQVWAAVSKEALSMIFTGADASGFEEDARLTAMWLWTLKTGDVNGDNGKDEEEDTDEDETSSKKSKLSGFSLEFDAARKIAQGLGAHLESLDHLVTVHGETATLIPVAARTRYLFGKEASEGTRPKPKKKDPQLKLDFDGEIKKIEEESGLWTGEFKARAGSTTLDQLHQCMILFASNRSEALKRLIVEEGFGRNPLFWRLAQALSALYPSSSDEKRWVDGVLARKKGLGF